MHHGMRTPGTRKSKLSLRAPWQVAEARTRFGSFLGAHLACMLVALGLAASGVLPTAHKSYEVVWTFIMPLAASCFLLETDVARCACMLAIARMCVHACMLRPRGRHGACAVDR